MYFWPISNLVSRDDANTEFSCGTITLFTPFGPAGYLLYSFKIHLSKYSIIANYQCFILKIKSDARSSKFIFVIFGIIRILDEFMRQSSDSMKIAKLLSQIANIIDTLGQEGNLIRHKGNSCMESTTKAYRVKQDTISFYILLLESTMTVLG